MSTLTDDVFAALASPVRRELLRLLLDGPRTVNDLASHFDMRRPSVSEHLKVLRDAELVSEHRVGRERRYQLEARPLVDLQDWLHPYERFWRERVKALRDVLEDM
ncbi:transcriptional regulator [Actinobacteria bacterium YIM 96077]|uniref:Transcriptional regulator n=1 Tax=Phytoactinopolyspora halophila TaxID=1981511 RepID=A0A329R3Q1_9ACTN|nr:metalloregulator ArsR/SmtB family transcription factor [Phytoactinopolyspora halophila]AYY12095.1 transcriptional regulator [Actinobacteria bacterium YIM 96077]RAW18669.1 transcriptional regulator [Phytoactinopolyspora halophila]